MILWESRIPVMNNLLCESKEEALKFETGQVQLVQHPLGWVYNQKFDVTKLLYDSNYQNEQSNSDVFIKHLKKVKNIIHQQLSDNDDLIVEIGCGKGYFLEMLEKEGLNASGYDPAYEGENPKIRKEYFGNNHQQGNMLVLRHVLEHINEPHNFLQKIAIANNFNGLIYIEIPSLEWILDHQSFFDITYEHVNYFRLVDLCGLFSEVKEKGYLFDNQYCYIIAELKNICMPDKLDVIPKRIMEFNFDIVVNDLVLALENLEDSPIYLWGGGARE